MCLKYIENLNNINSEIAKIVRLLRFSIAFNHSSLYQDSHWVIFENHEKSRFRFFID